MIDSKSQKFIQSAQNLCNNLDTAGKIAHINDSKYSNMIFELNNSLDYINNQKDNLSDNSTIQESMVKFAERFFKGLIKLLNVIKYTLSGADIETKNKIQNAFNPFALDIVNIVDEYGSLLKSYASDTKNLLSKMKNDFDIKREEFQQEEILNSNNTIDNNAAPINTTASEIKNIITPTKPKRSYKITTKSDDDYMGIYNNSSYSSSNSYDNSGGFDYSLFEDNDNSNIIDSTISGIKSVGRNIQNVGDNMEDISNSAERTYNNFKNTVDKIAGFIKNPFSGNNVPSFQSRFLSYSSNNTDNYNNNFISSMFKMMGNFIANAFEFIGNLFAELPDILSNGASHLEHIGSQYNRNGIDGILNDNESMEYISSGIYYSIKYIAIIWIARLIMRKVGSFLLWISGQEPKHRQR